MVPQQEIPVFTESQWITCDPPLCSAPWDIIGWHLSPHGVDYLSALTCWSHPDRAESLAGTEQLRRTVLKTSIRPLCPRKGHNSGVGLHRPLMSSMNTRAWVATTYLNTEPRAYRWKAPRLLPRALHPLCAGQCRHHVFNPRHGLRGYLSHRSMLRQAQCCWRAAFPAPASLLKQVRHVSVLHYEALQPSSWLSQMAGSKANNSPVITNFYLGALITKRRRVLPCYPQTY